MQSREALLEAAVKHAVNVHANRGQDVTPELEARIRADVARLPDDELEDLATIEERWEALLAELDA